MVDLRKPSMQKHRLFCPGPTPVSDAARAASLNTNVYHRTSSFGEVLASCRAGLAKVFGTKEAPLILTSSGSGAMEAAVVNFTDVGDDVAVINAGKFGERWEKLATTYQCHVATLKVEWGTAPEPEKVVQFLAKQKKPAKVLFLQANETSTGVFLPIKAILKKVRPKFSGLVVVDAISAAIAHPLEMDELGIDVLVSGGQKGFGIPPGLAFVALSKTAQKKFSDRPRFYFDLRRELKEQTQNKTAFTTATTLILSLNAALEEILATGLDRLYEQHACFAKAAAAAAKAMQLKLFAPENPSHALTAMMLPPVIDGKKLLKSMREEDGVIMAGGQDHLEGKIVRLAHLGFVDRLDLVSGVAALELALHKAGAIKELGKGVAAATREVAALR